jgi:ferritin-like protein
MAASSAGFHEASEKLTAATMDMHRAIVSLMEELEAVDWYQQRVDAASDDELREILAHNRDEEKEHAAMVLEWIRRRDPAFDTMLREYLFTTSSIVRVEEAATGKNGSGSAAAGSIGAQAGAAATLGSLRGGR